MIQRPTRQGIILLALLAVLSWIVSRESEVEVTAPVSELDIRLNFALSDFDGRMLDDAGAVNLQIRAPMLRSDAQSGLSTVEQPELQIRQQQEQWYITAESAIITADREHVSLVGDVYLTRRNTETGELLEISTKDVMLNVTPRTASSDAEVNIRHFNNRLDAVGMQLDMISNSFELKNDVRGYYETP
ncbi:MAG: LPS export ABC transporter periplasmic protein LptC [Xanthomonadales bacterium]|nr:LPS export ABC transporter periplasmic protein LptC [Gammaproteobacteria bacterium]MBT8053057.1 LPS export ABC transporter periplasmic protein LptC [Gammaproteobacteria bacterium]NND56699.1 LPS export ABC transporter periplasmic protein LptC [Xanthomonadales bacterium]NNK52684.1 LPS export ABC transporter periplasmic protein LptC [Xanthomonadales bacterium]